MQSQHWIVALRYARSLALQTVWVLAAVLLAAMPLAAQGITIVQEQILSNGRVKNTRLQLTGTQLRIEESPQAVTIFDGAARVIVTLDTEAKTYRELAVPGLAPELQPLRTSIEERLRERLSMEHRPTGSGRAGQWPCMKYEGFRGQQKVQELCAADPKALGLTAADLETLRQAVTLLRMLPMEEPLELSYPVMLLSVIESQGVEGVPVGRTAYLNGAVTSAIDVKEIRKEAIPPTAFQIPSDYKKATVQVPPGLQ